MKVSSKIAPGLPSLFHELGNRSLMVAMLIVGFGPVLYICGTHKNGWMRVVPPALGPVLAGLFLTVRPWNPYRGSFALESWRTTNDPRAQRLISLVRSSEAMWVIWRNAATASGVLLPVSSVISLLSLKPSSWNLPYAEVLTFSVIAGVMSLGWLYHALVRLLFRTNEQDHRPSD